MGVLDSKIQPGQPVTVNAEYHNELVTKLVEQGSQQIVQVRTSTSRVLVDYDDDSLAPGSVVISDETNWHGLTASQLYISCSVTGLGELADTQIDPNATTTWTWDASDWSSSSLPGAVTVTFTPYFLTSDTHGDSAATVGALAAYNGTSTVGDRRVVRADRTVYEFSGSGWDLVAGTHWSAGSSRTVSFVVEQGFDPDYNAGLSPRLVPEADYLRMQGGAGRVSVQDFTSFPDGTTAVERAVVAKYMDADGNEVAPAEGETHSPGLSVAGGDVADWMAAASPKAFTLEATEPGVVKLTATYTYTQGSSKTLVTTRLINIDRPARGASLAEDVPSLPDVTLTALNGKTRIVAGIAVTKDTITDIGAAEIASKVPSNDVLNKNLAARLSVNGIADPEASRALAAAETLRSVFANGVGGRLRQYTLTLKAGTDVTTDQLKAIKPGQGIYLKYGLLKVTANGGLTTNDASETVVSLTVVGKYSGEDLVDDGWVSTNAELISLSIECGYGTLGASDFPLVTTSFNELLAPSAVRPEIEVILPRVTPEAITDAWYTKVHATSLWLGGESTTGTLTSDWVKAEKPATGEDIRIAATRAGDTFTFDFENMSEFYGKIYWADVASIFAAEDDPSIALAAKKALPTNYAASLPASRYEKEWQLVLEGHVRGRAGTSGPYQRVVSDKFVPVGTHVLAKDAAPVDLDSAPATNGIVWRTTAGAWMSIGGTWVQIAPAASDHYTKSEVHPKADVYTKTAVDAAFYSMTAADNKFVPRSSSMLDFNVADGSSITADKLIVFTLGDAVYKIAAERVGDAPEDPEETPTNTLPTPSFTITPDSGTEPLVVTLDASATTDEDDDTLSYLWNFGDGSSGVGKQTVHTYNNDGTFTITLTVDDGTGTAQTSQELTVDAASGSTNVAPVAAFTATPVSGVVPFTVAVDASDTTDANSGDTLNYTWSFGDGHVAVGETASHEYTTAGSYTITLTVSDGALQDQSTQAISAVHPDPTAVFTATPETGVGPLTVTFNGSTSVDPVGEGLTYSWDFGDDSTAGTGSGPTHEYTANGSYTVVLTVTDDEANTDTASKVITVTEEP